MTSDFIYTEVYKACLSKGIRQTIARNAAQKIVDDYKKGKYKGKLSKVIDSAIKEAVKENKRHK